MKADSQTGSNDPQTKPANFVFKSTAVNTQCLKLLLILLSQKPDTHFVVSR